MFFPYTGTNQEKETQLRLRNEQVLMQTPIFDVVEKTYEENIKRIAVKHPGAVAVIATTPRNHLILIRQFRAPVERWLWEIPAGTLEKGEKAEDCAKRELEEETGFTSSRWEYLFPVFLAPGYSSEIIHFFRARDARPVKEALQGDEDEVIYYREVNTTQALDLLCGGEVPDAKTVIGITRWIEENR